MIFSSLQFLFIFLPIVLIGYVLIKPQFSNSWLLLTSLYFYYLGAKEYLLLLLLIIGITYLTGLIEEAQTNKIARTITLVISIATMLFLLAYYKYFDFIIQNVNTLFHANHNTKNLILPIGISFYIFQAISYVVDVYRGEKFINNPINCALYISFFPQLIAGPIVRFHDIREFLDCKYRKIDSENISEGIWKFSVGLCKKVIIANNLGSLADRAFNVDNIDNFSILFTWICAIAYALQIYYDFSGYSDMAIGLGRVFGFKFQENFDYPYIASSIKDFWRRWHISLSQFFRDYVYIPLGGNRCKKSRWIINTLIVWTLTGVWHGASWTYILWGILYGILLIVETIAYKHLNNTTLFKIFARCYTFIAVLFLWVLFRSPNLPFAIQYIKNMLGFGSHVFFDSGTIYQLSNYIVLLIISAVLSTPIIRIINSKATNNKVIHFAETLLLIAGFAISVSYIYMGSYNPFLYFMF